MNEEVQFSLDNAGESMDKSIVHFVSELMKIRAGRANPQMLSGVMVDYYGSMTALPQVANVGTPDARTLTVQPWEKAMLAELNKAIGGSSKSQHCEGRAIDIDDVYGYMSNADMYEYIKNNLSFDQMIWEFGNSDNPDWVHVSYVNEDSNRNRCLLAYKDENNKTKYKTI